MFNNLDNQGSKTNEAVDDIFAETDKLSASNIETHNVGLAANGENLANLEKIETPQVNETKHNYLSIVIIIVIALAVLGGAYFIYLQFFSNSSNSTPDTSKTQVEVKKTDVAETQTENNFVPVIPELLNNPATTTMATSSQENNPDNLMATNTALETTTPVEEANIDSDSDGLTDSEENTAGTNINVIDTDNDGLSDYEEIKIYLTNPLLSDTDGDGYLDGVEVKGGYDPNVKGAKLPGNVIKK